MSDLPEGLRRASDGLPARETGPWATEKLEKLERYAQIFSTSMRNKWPRGIVFVDLMAGPGLCIDTRSPGCQEFTGSTLRALDTRFPFDRIIAIESNPLCFAALNNRVETRERAATCQLRNLDCNDKEVIAMIRDATDHALSLMFIDLLGTEVSMETIRCITNGRSVDLVVTWPEMDVVRNTSLMFEQADRWTRFFGNSAWRGIATTRSAPFRLRALQKLYVEELRHLGYTHTEFLKGVRNMRGRILYRPLFAARHELGLNFWRKAAATPEQQQGLF